MRAQIHQHTQTRKDEKKIAAAPKTKEKKERITRTKYPIKKEKGKKVAGNNNQTQKILVVPCVHLLYCWPSKFMWVYVRYEFKRLAGMLEFDGIILL